MENLRLKQKPFDFFADLSFVHGKKETKCRAFLFNENRGMYLRFPRILGATELWFEYAQEDEVRKISFSFSSTKGDRDLYYASLSSLGVGLYFGRICAKTVFGVYYATLSDSVLRFTAEETASTVQISVSRFLYPKNEAYLGGAIYHIFVDRFSKGSVPVNVKPEAVMIESFEKGIPEFPAYPGAYLENNTFYGGTLYGVAEKLDYIASLGVSLLYLSPIFEAYSNHKYDTADYMSVDEMFGGEKALAFLISEAKKRGIGVILDGVFNHTGSDSIYFNKKGRYPTVGAYQSKASPYYSWYEFAEYPNSYTCWWGIPILPRIHSDRAECRAYFTGQGGVIEKYAKMGIAGFRLDVADELSDAFIADIKRALAKENPQALLYGEVWEDASNKIAYGVRKRYYLGEELDGVMNYPLRKALLTYVLQKRTDELSYLFSVVYENTPKRILHMQMNLLGTHDTERILTLLGGEKAEGHTNEELSKMRMSAEQKKRAVAVLKMLYTAVATLPGLPMIYYGDEAGLEGYSDPFNRMPYPHGKENWDLISHYRKIGAIRKCHAVYKEGDFRLLSLAENFLAFARDMGAFSYITVINPSCTEITIRFDASAENLLEERKDKAFVLKPNEGCIYRCKKTTEVYIKTGEQK